MNSTTMATLLANARYYLGLLVLLALGVLTSPHYADGGNIFLSFSNLSDVLRQVSNIGVIAIGMTLVIIAGGIDLSVGSTMSLGSVLTAMLLTRSGWTSASGFAVSASTAVVFFSVLLLWQVFKPSGGVHGPDRPSARGLR